MRSKPSLKRSVMAGQTIVAMMCIVVVGSFWLLSAYLSFRREINDLKAGLLASQQEVLQNEVGKVVDFIDYQKKQTRQRLLDTIRQRVDEAHGIATNLYRENQGRLPDGDIQKLIKDALRPIRFNQDRGYFFITALDGTEVLFADRPEMEGRNMLEVRGGKGETVVRDMIALVRAKGEGNYEYTWTKPGRADRIYPKIAYVKHFAPLAWLIGSGEYLDAVESDIQNETLSRIEQIRFARGGYIFAGTWEGKSLAGPARGQNMIGVTDTKGVAIVAELIRLAKTGGGFLQYRMPALDGQKSAPKLSYVVGIDSWRWYVGAGAYLDDIDAMAAARQAELERSIALSAVNIGLILAGAMLFAVLSSNRIAGRIRTSVDELTRFFKRSATQLVLIEPQRVAYAEFEELARTFNQMAAERWKIEQERARLFALSIDMLCIAGFDGYFKEINPAWQKTLGWPEDWMLTTLWMDFVHPEDRQITIDAGEKLAAGQVVHRFENRYRCQNGDYRWLSWNSFPLPEEGLIFAVVRDVTEQKHADAARELDESRLEALLRLNQMNDASLQEIAGYALEEAVRLTRSTIGYIAFLNADQDVLTMHAWSKTAMEQCRIADKPIEYPVADTGLWGEAVRQRRPVITNDYHAHNPLKRGVPEGHVAVMRHMNVPIFDGDSIVLVAGVGNKDGAYDEDDIRQLRLLMGGMWSVSQRRKAEQDRQRLEVQLRQSHKMEAIGTLAGGIAHDFNNLLQAMQGYTELLLMDKAPGHSDFDGLSRIGEAIRRGSSLTRQMLTFSRKVDTRLETIALNGLIENLVSMLKHTIARMIAIDLDLAPGLWNIHADKGQIEQVIMNLMVNAKDAMPDGGRIAVATENITIAPGDAHSDLEILPGRYVQLAVADTGAGMDPATLKSIYDPFFTTKAPGKGTGLGLAMVYGIVKAHGGRIACHSDLGKGTRFTICLPARVDSGTADDSQPPVLPASGTETVLLVDDEAFIRDLGERILTRFGYTVLTAPTGELALEIVGRGEPVDLVVLDLIMPGMGGRQCLTQLAAQAPDLPVIVASGYAMDAPVAALMEKGAKGFIHKPYQLVEMLRLIRRVLDARPGNVPS